jgi:hypothetical protein
VLGQNGSIYTSTDAAGWEQHSSGTARWLTDAAYVDNQWFVCGYQGTLLSSTNLTDWSICPLPTGKSLFAAATQNGQLVLSGVEGVILRNRVIPQTSPIEILSYDLSTATDTNGLASTYELFLFGGQPDQVFEFQSTTDLAADGAWTNVNGVMEMYDPSGTLYAIRTRDATNAPSGEYYRTRLIP